MNNKHKGGINAFILFSMFSILLVTILGFVFVRYVITLSAENAQDDLAFSNLTVYKYIDKKSLGEDVPYFKIGDPLAAVGEFKKHLKINMALDDYLNTTKDSSVSGKVSIDEFIIYNVKDDNVEILTYNSVTGSFNTQNQNLKTNPVKTSNGFNVQRTMVHTTISFDRSTMFGEVKRESVSLDTDITK